jgi:hypothetical protein
MGFINGLCSFGHQSELVAAWSIQKKRDSTERWVDALAKAEYAHGLCREAALLTQREMFEEAEECATRGINALKERLVV